VQTRADFLRAAAGVALGSGAALDALADAGPADAAAGPGRQPAGLPARQHAWEAGLARDAHGNAVSPRFDRLLLFDLPGKPTAAAATRLEAVLRTLERRFPWSRHGLLFTTGWGPGYFEAVRVTSPVPRPERLSDFELPTLDDYALCLHLACDDEARLAQVEAALVHGGTLAGADRPVDLRPILTWKETRSGFTGARLPAAHQHVQGIPAGNPVSEAAPLFMGFKSGYTKNQASEDGVTILSGPLAGGTTMHVSRMRLRLDSWYGDVLDEQDRVARMFGPEVTAADVKRFTTDAPSKPDRMKQDAIRYGVVGHAQTSARARKHGRAVILRRDFDTVDGGQAGLHFVSLQRTIADFVNTRKAMNADQAGYFNPGITNTVNNGINEFIFVTHRANYAIPPRSMRSFPLLG
jgi:Dyp-type peroxidase, C-terminal